MRNVAREDTAPELAVRRFLHAHGLRFRLHVRGLAGTPDIVFPRHGVAVFVHGCFWHGHHCRHGSVRARSNAAFWARKIADNRERDRRKARALRAQGWRVLTVWECEVGKPQRLRRLAERITGKTIAAD